MPPQESSRFWVSSLLTPATVLLQLTSTNRDAVLAELIRPIPELQHDEEKRGTLFAALREREDLHSTGIGDGVALPHARTALSGLVQQPVIVFGRHSKGIHFNAIDRRPVQLFFLLVTTSVTQHLQILARISRLLRAPQLRQKLLTAERTEDVLRMIRDAETTT